MHDTRTQVTASPSSSVPATPAHASVPLADTGTTHRHLIFRPLQDLMNSHQSLQRRVSNEGCCQLATPQSAHAVEAQAERAPPVANAASVATRYAGNMHQVRTLPEPPHTVARTHCGIY